MKRRLLNNCRQMWNETEPNKPLFLSDKLSTGLSETDLQQQPNLDLTAEGFCFAFTMEQHRKRCVSQKKNNGPSTSNNATQQE